MLKFNKKSNGDRKHKDLTSFKYKICLLLRMEGDTNVPMGEGSVACRVLDHYRLIGNWLIGNSAMGWRRKSCLTGSQRTYSELICQLVLLNFNTIYFFSDGSPLTIICIFSHMHLISRGSDEWCPSNVQGLESSSLNQGSSPGKTFPYLKHLLWDL